MRLTASDGTTKRIYTYDGTQLVREELRSASTNATLTANARAAIDASSLRYRGYYYDSGTGFYYLQSRYYDPQVGRFISPDSYVSTGQGFAGNNMFAYCGNNPIMHIDDTGTSFKSFLKKAKSKIEEVIDWLNENALTEDGSYALYDNDRFRDEHPWHGQLIVITPSGPDWDVKEGNIGLGSVSADFCTGGWEWEKVDLSLLDFGHVDLAAEIKDKRINVGALASAWSPSIGFDLGNGNFLEIGLEIGAVGGSVKSNQGVKVNIALLFGFGFSVVPNN